MGHPKASEPISMTRSCRTFKKFQRRVHLCTWGGARGPRPSSVGRVTATPRATTPDTPDASAADAPAEGHRARPPRRRLPRLPTGTDDDAPAGLRSAGSRSRTSARSSTDGARPAKAVVGEQFTIGATVFREGHDAVNASVVLVAPDGSERVTAMTPANPGLNTWAAVVEPDTEGWWTYRVEGWSDPYGTWDHDATIKVTRPTEPGVRQDRRRRDRHPRLAVRPPPPDPGVPPPAQRQSHRPRQCPPDRRTSTAVVVERASRGRVPQASTN